MDRIETFSERLTSVLEANLTRVGVQQNADMRKISACVAIGAIPTLVGAIYGMNFEHMPELGERWAYPAVLALIALSCIALYRAFRRMDGYKDANTPRVLRGRRCTNFARHPPALAPYESQAERPSSQRAPSGSSGVVASRRGVSCGNVLSGVDGTPTFR